MANKDYKLAHRDLVKYIPERLRNLVNTSLVDNLFNRHMTHDESVPLFGYVGRKPSSPDDTTPAVPQNTVSRDVNALIPVFSFKNGKELIAFTAEDVIRKAEVLGVDADQSTWLYSQANNYAPPIDFDKFTNFFNYYWVGQSLPNSPILSWNPTIAPEYYVIAKPAITDLDKLNVRLGTTSQITTTGTGFLSMTWVVTFTDALNFTVQAQGAGAGQLLPSEVTQSFTLPTVTVESTSVFTVEFTVSHPLPRTLLSFKIQRDPIYDGDGNWTGNETFTAGDTFTITAPFISSSYTLTSVVSSGVKGKINNVNSLDTFQTIDGVQLVVGDRVLVKNQGVSAENGIYIVAAGAWTRAADFADPSTTLTGSRVYVTSGLVNAGVLFISSDTYEFNPAGTQNNTNDWQEHNYWMTSDEAVAAGFDVSTLVQATRPIIEFSANVRLNGFVQNGVPSDAGTAYTQYKTEFNQVPLFDLYRYDGTHAKLVSPLFFYVEDPTADIDPALQRRTKISSNGSSDFLFSHGFEDDNGNLLFCKYKDGSLKTIWHAGYDTPTISNTSFNGNGNGTISVQPSTNAFAAQQIWTFTATGPTSFTVVGSKNAELPVPYQTATVGTQYDNTLIKALITAGSTPFEAGDVFTVQFGNLETTRYVYRSADARSMFDLFGGPTADTEGVGAWLTPRMFYNNVAAVNNGEIPEGTIYSHFRGILANQAAGNIDNAFGGSIKLWGEQTNLLVSLLMQRDLTPISMIDFAQNQYEVALNAIIDIFCQKFPSYVSTNTIDTSSLVSYILAVRAADMDVKKVLYDTTASVIGFPVTLPAMGVTPLAVPGYVFDNELGATVFRHHDGHLSSIFTMSQSFLDRMVTAKTTVLRSDGSTTPAFGSYTTTMPASPYRGEFWLYPQQSGVQFRMFNVLGDTSIAPTPTATGDFWYDRPNGTLYVWDGVSWATTTNMSAAWVSIDPADMLNDVLLEIETRLYNGVNGEQRSYFSDTDVQDALTGDLSAGLARELSTWAALYGYDQFGSDYVSTDPFTWNYSGLTTAQFAPVNRSTVPARWYKALQAHQATVPGVIPTSRPNLEPWKLLGFSSKPSTWDAMYSSTVTPDMVSDSQLVGAVKAVLYSGTPLFTTLNGSITVDGVLLTAGDYILLVSEAAPANNGVWVVSNGGWSRPFMQQAGHVLTVSSGIDYSATAWEITTTQSTPSDPVLVSQVRYWTASMWADIQAARPTLKLSVDTNREILLPPYVNPSFSASLNALTTTLPPTPAKAYVYGEGSPVETVWQKSIEFRYSLARALFRKDPLAFIGNCWGFEWVNVDGILYDGFDVSMPGIANARFHGDTETRTRTPTFSLTALSGPSAISLIITHDGYTADRKFSFSVKTSTGLTLGYLHEGETGTISSNGYVITASIEDNGVPFHVGDSFTVTANADGSGQLITFNNSLYVKFLGFGQIFAQCLRNTSIDMTRGYAVSAMKNWGVNVGYRAGGLVATDDLKVFTDSTELPPSAYTLIFKKSPYASDTWLQALRVTVSQFGAHKTASNGFKVPSSDASDWVFKVQGYNNRYLTVKYFTYDHSADVTFLALNGAHTSLPWLHPTVKTGTVSAELPLTITGLQSLVDFLFGYSEYLESQGWEFDNALEPTIDAETGRARNWQLEIEKLVDRVYAGTAQDTGHLMNPFMDKVWFNQDTGLISEFRDTALFDIISDPAVFDTLGVKMDSSNVTVLRGREQSTIISSVPMFSVHAQTDEYEHLFIFNNYISPSTNEGLIYDPFTGSRVATMKFNGRRQATDTLRPEFGGHYLIGHEVKENIQASTDKLQHYYDTNYVFRDRTSTLHAMELLGFTPKQYLADLDLTDKSQFEFWRGLIQMKGTNASVDAFLNNNRFQDAKLDEYWAYKVAEYGDARTKVFPELKLYAEDALQQFTKFRFVSAYDNDSSTATFTQVIPSDESRWYSIDDLNSDMSFTPMIIGEFVLAADPSVVYSPMIEPGMVQVPFSADRITVTLDGGDTGFTVLNSRTILVSTAGELRVTGYGPDASKYSPVKVINYVAKEVTADLPMWSPAMNFHTPTAMESVNIIADTDPARYNQSTLVSGNANYDPLRAWGAKQVGRIWWDTTNLDYVPYHDSTIFGSIDERLNRWGALADYAANHIVEWVQSTVPPAEYDAQAATDAGNSDIDPASRADGTPYDKKVYSRTREWMIRPIAWSQAASPTVSAHTGGTIGSRGSFLSQSSDTTLFFIISSNMVALDNESFSADVVVDTRIGLFSDTADYLGPVSEANVVSLTKNITTELTPNALQNIADVSGFSFTVTPSSYNEMVYGQVQPSMSYSISQGSATDGTLINEWTVSSYLTLTVNGISSTVLIRSDVGTSTSGTTHNASFSVQVGDAFSFTFAELGLTIVATATMAGTHDTLVLAQAIDTAAATLNVFDAREITFLVPNPQGISSASNDPDSALTYGWRAWNVPTQAELDADSKYPNCEWYPMTGEFVSFTPSNADIKEAVAAQLTLNNGTVIDRYSTTWGDWTVHTDKYFKTVATSSTADVDIGEIVHASRVAVYVNGVAQLSSTFTISGSVVSISTLSTGDYITVILRAYSPTADELSFDPTVEDDLTVQEQYKEDYQYVSVPVRSADDGTITSTLYYFWVTGRSVAASGKTLSTKAITSLLTNGPSTYMTLQHLTPDSDLPTGTVLSSPVYDSIALSGLSYLVTKDSTFKLRLMNDNTLRDDPEGLNLKDTHAEWTLIRPGQRTRIPEALWNKLTDTACGADVAGNPLPAPERVAYDERNGTRTQYGFGSDQILAPSDLVTSTILYTILNTTVVDDSDDTAAPYYIQFLDFNESDTWFATAESTRNILTRIWNEAEVSQVNEIFFAVLNDICAANYELTDLFKTSRLSAYSVKVMNSSPVQPTYE